MTHHALEEFLRVANQYKLGSLETEKPHPLTINLSIQAKTDLPAAIGSLKQVDEEALMKLGNYIPALGRLGDAIHKTLRQGGRVFLCGCGATGRLSISLEVFCREGMVDPAYKDRFIGFMAGGDAALIKSIENFEDHPEYGARQLGELGFGQGDLLISATEGGETPFVIGATEEATRLSDSQPWFLYCNPEDPLKREVERSARVINNPNIVSVSLSTGPMGLSGSTRMQASTVLMAAVGWAIQYGGNADGIRLRLEQLREFWRNFNLTPLGNFIKAEAGVYRSSEYVIYETKAFGVTVLTDTTERSPTFSLAPFENLKSPADAAGWCYLSIPSAADTPTAWKAILARNPRCLEWEGIQPIAGLDYLNGFYVGNECSRKRAEKTRDAVHHVFKIDQSNHGYRFAFKKNVWKVEAPELTLFEHNLLLKLSLNIHSTLVMGILGRFESNLMTYVKPSNYKLIDRCIRYVQRLSELRGIPVQDYERIAGEVFSLKDQLSSEDAMVIRVLEALGNTFKH